LTLFKNHELFSEVSCKDLSPQYAAVYLRRPYENTPLVLLIRLDVMWKCVVGNPDHNMLSTVARGHCWCFLFPIWQTVFPA